MKNAGQGTDVGGYSYDGHRKPIIARFPRRRRHIKTLSEIVQDFRLAVRSCRCGSLCGDCRRWN